jgi:hypothetical protein
MTAEVEKVEDVAAIMGYGVTATPALVVDERRARERARAQPEPDRGPAARPGDAGDAGGGRPERGYRRVACTRRDERHPMA